MSIVNTVIQNDSSKGTQSQESSEFKCKICKKHDKSNQNRELNKKIKNERSPGIEPYRRARRNRDIIESQEQATLQKLSSQDKSKQNWSSLEPRNQSKKSKSPNRSSSNDNQQWTQSKSEIFNAELNSHLGKRSMPSQNIESQEVAASIWNVYQETFQKKLNLMTNLYFEKSDLQSNVSMNKPFKENSVQKQLVDHSLRVSIKPDTNVLGSKAPSRSDQISMKNDKYQELLSIFRSQIKDIDSKTVSDKDFRSKIIKFLELSN